MSTNNYEELERLDEPRNLSEVRGRILDEAAFRTRRSKEVQTRTTTTADLYGMNSEPRISSEADHLKSVGIADLETIRASINSIAPPTSEIYKSNKSLEDIPDADAA